MRQFIKKWFAIVAALALVAGCNQTDDLKQGGANGDYPIVAKGGLRKLLESNASILGVLNDVQPPFVYAAFQDGKLERSTDPEKRSAIRGTADAYTRPDMNCLGFEYKRLSNPGRAERYLVCEALTQLRVSNSLPRGQDFVFPAGALFLEYDPPPNIGYPQYYYLKLAERPRS